MHGDLVGVALMCGDRKFRAKQISSLRWQNFACWFLYGVRVANAWEKIYSNELGL